MKKSAKKSQKIVVKVGSSILTGGSLSIVPQNLRRIVRHIANFSKEGKDIILVTSGAIASGLSVLGFKKRPTALSELQAAAAVGQNILMQAYNSELEKFGLKGAQILLTREDFSDRKRYLNARNTINTLLQHKVIPIINENDAVSVDEIKFGDNDTLSARVAAAVEADGLLILTDIDGLYESFDPKTHTGKLIKEVKKITPEIEKIACGTDKTSCIGGMSTKIEAVRIATNMGITSICASGVKDTLSINFDALSYALYDGTRFPAVKFISSKKHWIAFEAKTHGRIFVDDGAKVALVQNFKSLLAPGVVNIEGDFKTGDIVEIADSRRECFAKGKVNFSCEELSEVKGKKVKNEVVHRDNLVILG